MHIYDVIKSFITGEKLIKIMNNVAVNVIVIKYCQHFCTLKQSVVKPNIVCRDITLHDIKNFISWHPYCNG